MEWRLGVDDDDTSRRSPSNGCCWDSVSCEVAIDDLDREEVYAVEEYNREDAIRLWTFQASDRQTMTYTYTAAINNPTLPLHTLAMAIRRSKSPAETVAWL